MQSERSRQQLLAVRRLRELVLDGTFKPGERVSEQACVDLLGISRTPVRLALGALAHEGLLEAHVSGGFLVKRFSLDDILDAIELRGALEGMAAKFAAQRSSGKVATAKLRSILISIDELLDDTENQDDIFEGYVEQNERFHTEMLALAKCELLERSLALIIALPFASPNSFVHIQSDVKHSRHVLMNGQFQHRCLVDAIESGDAARAQNLGQEHARLAAGNLKHAMDTEQLYVQVPGAQLIGIDGKDPAELRLGRLRTN